MRGKRPSSSQEETFYSGIIFQCLDFGLPSLRAWNESPLLNPLSCVVCCGYQMWLMQKGSLTVHSFSDRNFQTRGPAVHFCSILVAWKIFPKSSWVTKRQVYCWLKCCCRVELFKLLGVSCAICWSVCTSGEGLVLPEVKRLKKYNRYSQIPYGGAPGLQMWDDSVVIMSFLCTGCFPLTYFETLNHSMPWKQVETWDFLFFSYRFLWGHAKTSRKTPVYTPQRGPSRRTSPGSTWY